MNCKEFLSVLNQYVDGELSPTATADARAHCSECADCRRAHRAMVSLLNTMHHLDDVPVPEDLADTVLREVNRRAREKREGFRLPEWLLSPKMYLAASACMLVFVVMLSHAGDQFRLGPDGNTVPPMFAQPTYPPHKPFFQRMRAEDAADTEPTPSAETVSAQQVETETASVQTAAPDTASAQTAVVESVPVQTPEVEAARVSESSTNTTFAPAPTPSSSAPSAVPSAVPEVDKAEETAPVKAETVAPREDAYKEVSSLLKRSITFVVWDAACAPIFEETKAQGADAVRNALFSAGYDVSTREGIMEDYTADYNALVEEANRLAKSIREGDTALSSLLKQTELKMQTLWEMCEVPVLFLAYE